MSELSAAMGDSGPRHRIVKPVGDTTRTYEFSMVTQGVKIAFEKALYERAKAAARLDRADLGEDWYATKLDQLRERYEEGEFAFESPKGQRAMKSNAGALMFLGLLVSAGDGPVTEVELIDLMASHGTEIKEITKTIMRESFPSIGTKKGKEGDEGGDPKKDPPPAPAG